jgi:hypothetical protein
MSGSTPFRSEQDYANMHQLIVENYMFSGQQLYPSIADLDYWRYLYDASPENIHQAQLWEDPTGKLLGFVWMNAEATDLVCHYQHRALEEDMLEWAEQQYFQRYPCALNYRVFVRKDVGSSVASCQQEWVGAAHTNRWAANHLRQQVIVHERRYAYHRTSGI